MENNISLDYCKLLDVKDLEVDNSDYPNAGIDFFMPRMNDDFIKAVTNEKLNPNLRVANTHDWINFIQNGCIVLAYNIGLKYYEICEDVAIPSGICLNLPKNYHAHSRCKSSNFNNNYTVIDGLIDQNYTYGMGIQIHLLRRQSLKNNEVIIYEDQKISQFIVLNSTHVDNLNKNDKKYWDLNSSIKNKRTLRTGGFGSTGKF